MTNIVKQGPFTIVNSEIKYKNPWIQVREDQVIRPDGKKGIFGVMSTNDSVLILPIFDSGEVCLIRQYRYAIGQYSLEVPAGGIDEGESIETAARRELKEEVGLLSQKLVYLNHVHLGTAVINSRAHLWVARKLRKESHNRDSGEKIETVMMPFQNAVQSVMSGEIVHAACALLILKAWRMWKSGELN